MSTNRLRDPSEVLPEKVLAAGKSNVTPTISGGGETFDPVSVTRLNLILPFEMQADQTGCGETIVDTDGDYNVRVTMEGSFVLSQLQTLLGLRDNADTIQLNWSGNGTGIQNVSFDRIELERTDEHDTMEVDGRVEPVFTFQIQSKEQSQSESN